MVPPDLPREGGSGDGCGKERGARAPLEHPEVEIGGRRGKKGGEYDTAVLAVTVAGVRRGGQSLAPNAAEAEESANWDDA